MRTDFRWMPRRTSTAGVLLLWFAMTAGFAKYLVAENPVSTSQRETAELSLTSLRNCTSRMLRLQATMNEGTQQDQVSLALCDLYVRMRTDPRFDSSEMLQQDAAKIRRRLLSVAQQKKSELKRNKIDPPSTLARDIRSALTESIERASAKSQMGNLRGDGSLGDPAGLVGVPRSEGAFAAGGAFDNGWQLVELIQNVVSPDFWQLRGGSGTIQYFALRRVLVVSATTDVHEQIRDLLLILSR